MSYYFAKTLDLPFDRAVEKTIAAPKAGRSVLAAVLDLVTRQRKLAKYRHEA